jgi:hypothetical protein
MGGSPCGVKKSNYIEQLGVVWITQAKPQYLVEHGK